MPKLKRWVTQIDEPIGWCHWCPACEEMHCYAVERPAHTGGPQWTFNGNVEKPSFQVSMNITWGNRVTGHAEMKTGGQCHYFVTDGNIKYQNDCTHHLKGQTVPLPDLPEFVL
jgi:hypothetical protein